MSTVDIEKLSAVAAPVVQEFCDEQFHVQVVNVSTADGFVVAHQASPLELEGDSMAAVSSALLSLSEASVDSVRGGEPKMTMIQSERAIFFVVCFEFLDVPVVVTVVASTKISIGQALFLTNRFCERLRNRADA